MLGVERIRANKTTFDGIGVLMYFIFAIAAMDGVLDAALQTPGRVMQFVLFAFVMAGLGFVASALMLRNLGSADRFVSVMPLSAQHGPADRGIGRCGTKDDVPVLRAGAVPILSDAMIVKPIAETVEALGLAR